MNSSRKNHGPRLVIVLMMSVLSGSLLLSGCAQQQQAPVEAATAPDGSQTIKVVVKGGYNPNNIVAKAGKPLKLEFYRDEDPQSDSCDKTLLIPSENIQQDLTAGATQPIELKAHAAGTVGFECGMHMFKGTITFR